MSTKLKWVVRSDGSFDLEGAEWRILDAYPGIDGVPLRSIGVSVNERAGTIAIDYTFPSGSMTLRLGVHGSTATVDCTLDGMSVAPARVDVLGWGTVPGATRLFKQGHGIGGGSGVVDLQTAEHVESFGMVSLFGDDERGLALWAADHTRFENRYFVAPLPGETNFRLSVGYRTEGIPLPEGRLELPTLHVTETSDVSGAMRAAAADVAQTMSARPIRPASCHWCSWYYLYHNLDMRLLGDYLEGFSQIAEALDYVQMDAGYFPSAGDWLSPNVHFPQGLKPAFDRIREAGYRPGIWIAPFMVGNHSQLAKAHPDWLLRDLEDNPVTPWRGYGEPKVWGFRDEETYVLDSSHPDAFEYLRQVFRELREYGADMFKTDFMYWGYQDSLMVRRHSPGKTSVEYFREVLQMIRQEIGPETFWLACIAPFLPFVGYADAMRIGGDVGVRWAGPFGPQNMLVESMGDQHLNQVLWQNDPDVLLIRDFHTELTDDEVVTLALWQAILGGVVATSDPLHEISPERLALWRFVRPSRHTSTATVPLSSLAGGPMVAVRGLASGDSVVLVVNRSDLPIRDWVKLKDLKIAGKRFAFLRTPALTTRIGETDELRIELRPHASALFHLGIADRLPDGPMVH